MPQMKIANGNSRGIVHVTDAIGIAILDGEISQFGKKKFVISTDDYQLTVKGKGFRAEDGDLVAGKITKISVVISDETIVTEPARVATISGFGNAGDLFSITRLHDDAARAMDGYLFGLDWKITGSDGIEGMYDFVAGFSGLTSNFAGKDIIKAKGGNDTFQTGDGNDKVWGDEGDDRLHGNGGNDKLFGGADDDNMFGDDGTDTLKGGDGADFLYGGAGRDKIDGGDGDDQIDGGTGNDRLKGGEGADSFIFGALDGDGGFDKVLDYDPTQDTVLGILFNVTATATDDGVLVEHDGGSVLFVGLAIEDWG